MKIIFCDRKYSEKTNNNLQRWVNDKSVSSVRKKVHEYSSDFGSGIFSDRSIIQQNIKSKETVPFFKAVDVKKVLLEMTAVGSRSEVRFSAVLKL